MGYFNFFFILFGVLFWKLVLFLLCFGILESFVVLCEIVWDEIWLCLWSLFDLVVRYRLKVFVYFYIVKRIWMVFIKFDLFISKFMIL